MKTLLFSLLLLALLLLGCNEAPVQPESAEIDDTQIGPNEIIQIPPRAGGGPSISKTETIGAHLFF